VEAGAGNYVASVNSNGDSRGRDRNRRLLSGDDSGRLSSVGGDGGGLSLVGGDSGGLSPIGSDSDTYSLDRGLQLSVRRPIVGDGGVTGRKFEGHDSKGRSGHPPDPADFLEQHSMRQQQPRGSEDRPAQAMHVDSFNSQVAEHDQDSNTSKESMSAFTENAGGDASRNVFRDRDGDGNVAGHVDRMIDSAFTGNGEQDNLGEGGVEYLDGRSFKETTPSPLPVRRQQTTRDESLTPLPIPAMKGAGTLKHPASFMGPGYGMQLPLGALSTPPHPSNVGGVTGNGAGMRGAGMGLDSQPRREVLGAKPMSSL